MGLCKLVEWRGGRELGKEGEQRRDRQKGVQKGPAVGKTGQSLPSLDKPCPSSPQSVLPPSIFLLHPFFTSLLKPALNNLSV